MLGVDLFNILGMEDGRLERNAQLLDNLREWISPSKRRNANNNSTDTPVTPVPFRLSEEDSMSSDMSFSRRPETSVCVVVPEDENETLKQFVLDAPRMDVTVDGDAWTGNTQPDQLLSLLFRLLPRWSAVLAAEFCTQTALAPFFCSVRETLQPDTHFVDGGRQAIFIDTREKRMRVEKPFKVVDFDDQMNARTLFVVTLILHIDLEKGMVEHHFSRSSVVEKDWVYVEELSVEDANAFANGAVAEDIAASAMRMKSSGT